MKIIDFNPNQLIIEVINIKNGETTDKQTIPLDKSPLYLSFNEKDLKLVKEDRNNYDFKLETLKNTKFLYINQNKGKK